MDYVTHIVTGATGYRLIKTNSIELLSRFQERSRSVCAGLFFLASVLQDVDNISRLWGMDAYIIHHRGITHSLPFAFISSFLLALAFAKSSGMASIVAVFIVTLLGMLFHLYMDLITSYGTQLLLPFTNHRFRLDWVFIIDPIYTFVLAIVLLLSFVLTGKKPALSSAFSGSYTISRPAKNLITWIFVLWVIIYPVCCGILRFSAAGFLSKANPALLASEFDLVPDLGTPFIWKLVVRENNTYHVGSVNIIRKSVDFADQKFTPLDEVLSDRLSEELPSLKIYRWFAVYPYQRIWRDDGKEKILEIGDVRFFSPLRIIQSRRSNPPFTLFIKLSESGRPISLSYGRPPLSSGR
jgi:inner membrane protein